MSLKFSSFRRLEKRNTELNLAFQFSRFRAALVHLLVSASVAVIAALLVFLVWYPGAYREISGGQELFLILVAVDVVLGPMLTFAVFNTKKSRRELFADIGLIAVIQIGALLYGLWTVYQARPVFLVHEVDRFQVVTATDIDPLDLKKAFPAYRQLPLWGIQVIGVRQALDEKERLTSLDLALAGKDVSMRPNWWQPLNENHRETMMKRGRPLDFLASKPGYSAKEVSELINSRGVTPEDVLCFPVVGRRTDWTVLINKKNMEIVGFVQVDSF